MSNDYPATDNNMRLFIGDLGYDDQPEKRNVMAYVTKTPGAPIMLDCYSGMHGSYVALTAKQAATLADLLVKAVAAHLKSQEVA